MLTWGLAVGALLCLTYFVVIVAYSGIGTAYAFIWILFAAGLGGTAFCVWHYQRHPRKLLLQLSVSLVTLCGTGLVILLVLQILIIGKVPQVAESDLEYVIVLGSPVRGEKPGRTLLLRLEKAAEYGLQNPETILVLSGGRTSKENGTEAEVMKQYLLDKGVPEEQMVLEQHSVSTVENIAYSRILIDTLRKKNQEEHHQDERALPAYLPAAMGQKASNPHQIGILTSNFHLYRAMQIAKKQGMQEISGIAAASDRILFVHFCFRDGLAILKERLAGNL
ncbi:MAG: YdcF family protein [Lachnospiraceae bacterium]|nr:YdcF family protein [Lachnospiraceae bacterium]MCI9283802.1 YdcF family protein [Lachnospiraceae bacterium]